MGLQKEDLKHLVDHIIEIDSYKSKMGEDQDIVTIAFSVQGLSLIHISEPTRL